MSVAALIVAAGSGTRAGTQVPKQYVPVGGRPLLRHCLHAFLKHPRVDVVQVVINPDHEAHYARAIAGLEDELPPPVAGGATRQESVRRGLTALAERLPEDTIVMIHDAARPFLPPALIDALLAALEAADGALPALEVVDTIKRVDSDGFIVETPPRHLLRAAQTPQTFRLGDILAAHEQAAALDVEFSDDAAVAERAGLRVKVIAGAHENRKITHPQDFAWAEEYLKEYLKERQP